MAGLAPDSKNDEPYCEKREQADITQRDAILLERSMNSDRAAFGELAKRYFSILYAAALSILGSPEEAEDACQEALIKAFRYIRTIKDTGKFGPWARSIVRQECFSRLQKKSKTTALLKKISLEYQQSSVIVIHSEKPRRLYHRQLLQYAMQRLSERTREIVLLHYMNGLSCEEIASQTGARIGTIKSHLFKARQKMLNYLSEIGVHSIEDI